MLGLVGGAWAGGPPWGVTGALVVAALAAAGGRWLGPRRYRLVLDAGGVRVGRLLSTVVVPWAEVAAFGVVETWTGRRGRILALAVCRHGVDLAITVPALTFAETGWRIGSGPRPADAVEGHRPAVLAPVGGWAEAEGVPVVASDVDSWWELRRPG